MTRGFGALALALVLGVLGFGYLAGTLLVEMLRGFGL